MSLIFFVDDSQASRVLARHIDRYWVATFASWPGLLSAYATAMEKPRAIVADLSLPAPDTFEVLRAGQVPPVEALVLITGHVIEIETMAQLQAQHAGFRVETIRKSCTLAQDITGALDRLLCADVPGP